MDVVTALAARMVVVGGLAGTEEDAARRVAEALSSGAALERFRANVEAQGGDPQVADDPSILPAAPIRREIAAGAPGWLAGLPARRLAL